MRRRIAITFSSAAARGMTAAFVLLSGCASYTDTTSILRANYTLGNYEAALADIDKSGLKNSSSSKLLYHLEKSMILDRMGSLESSRKELIKADVLADKLYTTSVSKTAASFVVSEDMKDYSGEDYEKVAIQTMLALSFIASNDLPNAQVAARRINRKLAEINGTYTDEKKNAYSEDGFARYLSGLVHEARGDLDNAIVEYNNALKLYSGEFRRFSAGQEPGGLLEAYYRLLVRRGRPDRVQLLRQSRGLEIAAIERRIESQGDPAKSGQITVLHEVGQISPKVSVSDIINTGRQVIRLSFPMIRFEKRFFGASGIKVGSDWTSATVASDMDAIGAQCLDDQKGRLIAKSLARGAIKSNIIEGTRQNYGDGAALLANIITAATETADTRSWSLMPGQFLVSRVWLPAGTHQITVKTAGRETPVTIKLRPGELKLIRATDSKPAESGQALNQG